jgi:hypothetical protein
MKKKNVSATYSRRVSVANVVEDVSNAETQQQAVSQRPVSAGGRSDIPATLSQEHLQFVDGIDEVPPWLQATVWALITRMNQLTYIDGDFDFERMMCGVRAMLRPFRWARKISLADMSQIEYFVGVQLRKSKHGLERKFIAPGFTSITHQELQGNPTVIDERQGGFAAQGMVNKLQGGRRSDRRG